MKILITIFATLLIVFTLSFLLDLPLIANNWLRYTVVVLLVIAVLALGLKMAWQFIKDLKGKIDG